MSRTASQMVMLGAGILISYLAAAAAAEPGSRAAADTKPATSGNELAEPKVQIVAGSRTTLAEVPFLSLSCEASNPNKLPLMFVGYRPDSFEPPVEKGRLSPIYVVELQRDGKWREHPIGWCGTGMDGIELPAGPAQSFAIAVPADPAIQAVRVGIHWSRPIAFETAEPDAFKTAWSESFSLAKIENDKEKSGKP